MITNQLKMAFYKALLEKNPAFEGVFFVGVKTTGVFCRPTCPAKKPLFENCEFFEKASEALLAAYRPCKRCQPLSNPGQTSAVVQKLVEAIEASPEKRWKEQDLENLSVDASTARRQFKKRFGMTFVEYARCRRMGLAMKEIREGRDVIEAQLSAGYESSSGFRDAFSKIMGAPPSHRGHHRRLLKASWIDTPLGPMIAIGDETHLHLLEFVSRRGLEREVERMRSRLKCAILPGETPPLRQIEKELKEYFAGTLKEFLAPLHLLGSPFQKEVWQALMKIPYGTTCSYEELAKAVKRPTAFRAVAGANGANQLALVIPCHRVINKSGALGGYGGGIERKEWLIKHEKEHA